MNKITPKVERFQGKSVATFTREIGCQFSKKERYFPFFLRGRSLLAFENTTFCLCQNIHSHFLNVRCQSLPKLINLPRNSLPNKNCRLHHCSKSDRHYPNNLAHSLEINYAKFTYQTTVADHLFPLVAALPNLFIAI